MIVAAHDTIIDMKSLEKHLKSGSGNLRAGDGDIMEKLLGVKKGAVNIFSILNDTNNKIALIVDHRLMNNCDLIGFHPMQNDATTSITSTGMKKII